MEAKALEKVLSLADQARGTVEIDGRKYVYGDLRPVFKPEPTTLEVESLTGLVDYVSENRDGVTPGDCVVLVKDHTEVKLYGGRDAEFLRRPVFVVAEVSDKIRPFKFGEYMDYERFMIGLLSLFQYDENLKEFVPKVTSVKSVGQDKTEDNGVSVQRTVSEGIECAADREVIKLRPFRTFADVQQPQVSLIFRVTKRNGELQLALFEADGGAWVNEARRIIKEYLVANLPAGIPILA